MEYAVSLLLGIGLSASCGFRVFVPLLAASSAGLLGLVKFSSGFEWMGNWISFTVFAAATVFEIAAYYIPWLDNALDTIAKPLAVVAGSILSISFLTEWDPMLRWILGIIVGGGSAGVIAAGTGVIRAASSAVTGGFANWVVATAEHLSAIILSILSIILPVLAGSIVIVLLVYLMIKSNDYRGKRKKSKKQSSHRNGNKNI